MRIHHLVARLAGIIIKAHANIAAAKPKIALRITGAFARVANVGIARTAPTLPQKQRVVGYVRRSSAAEFCASVERQEKLINDVAVARCGHLVDHMYVDDKGAGRTLERPAMQRLLEAARNGEIDVVIVEDPDRLARSHRVINELQDLFKLHGVTLMFGWQSHVE